MDISNLTKSLENGVCPAEVTEFDQEKVLYNIRYHDPAFYDNKFPIECRQIPAYDKIIDLIVEKNEDNSPLKEMTERNNISKQYKDDDEVSCR